MSWIGGADSSFSPLPLSQKLKTVFFAPRLAFKVFENLLTRLCDYRTTIAFLSFVLNNKSSGISVVSSRVRWPDFQAKISKSFTFSAAGFELVTTGFASHCLTYLATWIHEYKCNENWF